MGTTVRLTNMVPHFPTTINQLFTTWMYVYTYLFIGEQNIYMHAQLNTHKW